MRHAVILAAIRPFLSLFIGKVRACAMASPTHLSSTKRRKVDARFVQQDGPAAGSAIALSADSSKAQGTANVKRGCRRSKLPKTQVLEGAQVAGAQNSASEVMTVREAPSGAVLVTLEASAAPEEGSDINIVRTIDGLVTGRLVKRYKRFLADVQANTSSPEISTFGTVAKQTLDMTTLESTAAVPSPCAVPEYPTHVCSSINESLRIDGGDSESKHTVVHCPNTGPMTGLLDLPLANVWLSTSANAKRKYAHTLEAIQPEPHGPWVGVHSASANGIVRTMLQRRLIADLLPYLRIRQEVKYGEAGKSRVDFVLETAEGGEMYVEVKSVTLAEDLRSSEPGELGGCTEGSARIGLFPDTVSDRAQRHVKDLMGIVAAGGQAAMIFVIQRGDCNYFAPCHAKDPAYGRLVLEAAAAGVRVIALRCGLEGDVENGRGVVRYLGPAQVVLQHGQS